MVTAVPWAPSRHGEFSKGDCSRIFHVLFLALQHTIGVVFKLSVQPPTLMKISSSALQSTLGSQCATVPKPGFSHPSLVCRTLTLALQRSTDTSETSATWAHTLLGLAHQLAQHARNTLGVLLICFNSWGTGTR